MLVDSIWLSRHIGDYRCYWVSTTNHFVSSTANINFSREVSIISDCFKTTYNQKSTKKSSIKKEITNNVLLKNVSSNSQKICLIQHILRFFSWLSVNNYHEWKNLWISDPQGKTIMNEWIRLRFVSVEEIDCRERTSCCAIEKSMSQRNSKITKKTFDYHGDCFSVRSTNTVPNHQNSLASTTLFCVSNFF